MTGLIAKLKVLFSILVLVTAFVQVGCSNSQPSTTNGSNTPPTDDDGTDDVTDEEPSALDSQVFIPLTQYLSELTPADGAWAFRAEALQIFFGATMSGFPSVIEAGTTGIRMIHNSTSGELRFETSTNQGLFHADLVSIPSTAILNGTQVDMIFSSPISSWLGQYSSAYSLVRVTGTHSAGILNGQVCSRTVAVADWDSWGNPLNMVATVFSQAVVYGAYTSVGINASTLRSLVNCVNVGTYADVPNLAVKRAMGNFSTPIENILPQ